MTPELDPIVTPELDPMVMPELDPIVMPELDPIVTPELDPIVMPELDPTTTPELVSIVTPFTSVLGVTEFVTFVVTCLFIDDLHNLSQSIFNAGLKLSLAAIV